MLHESTENLLSLKVLRKREWLMPIKCERKHETKKGDWNVKEVKERKYRGRRGDRIEQDYDHRDMVWVGPN